jgi:subtilisin family serine protease
VSVIHKTLILLFIIMPLLGSDIQAQSAESPSQILLRRASFDPLTAMPAELQATAAIAATTLQLIQFSQPIDEGIIAELTAAGITPLVAIPEHALLVRMPKAQPALTTIHMVRWSGALPTSYKQAAELDALPSQLDSTADLWVVATPDANQETLATALLSYGAQILSYADLLSGPQWRILLPASQLPVVIERDDIIWVEPFQPRAFQDDRARAVVGMDLPGRPTWLTGASQIIAITDSGLDVESNLSQDFAGRLVRAFGTAEMLPGVAACQAAGWSDRNGHGTHVAGLAAGNGSLSAGQYRGIAPLAGLVIQSTSSGGSSLNCFPDDDSYLSKAYSAGARIQNGSFGSPTGGSFGSPRYGDYTAQDQLVDDFLWRHPKHLFVVAAGNAGVDLNTDGVVDRDSINTPATAKNVLSVGASENNRPPSSAFCGTSRPEDLCQRSYGFSNSPALLANDFISNRIDGLVAFSGRGPAEDGRIKPEIVAPGSNMISARSHMPSANYPFVAGSHYGYLSGTSMASPVVAGMAALTRQWLSTRRGLSDPSAALVRAMLLNGASDLQPGQYGTGSMREIGPGWPNTSAGWGRAALGTTLAFEQDSRLWFSESAGLAANQVAEFPLQVAAGQPLRVSLSYTDYPGTPLAARALVNNLNLELVQPDTSILRGNQSANMAATCRDLAGADLCNPTESIEIAAPVAGTYLVRVRAAVVSPLSGPQPFALVASAASISDASLTPPTLQLPVVGSTAAVQLRWNAIANANYYRVEASPNAAFTTIIQEYTVTATQLTTIQNPGTFHYRVKACRVGGCSAASNTRSATTTAIAYLARLPVIVR